jgi:pimeloyl-ACP methyl ester carboxylesterase
MGSTRFALADGRTAQAEEYGDPVGVPVLWFHGAGSSRLEAYPLDRPAKELGLRVVSLDRPGCGGSDPNPEWRTVVDYAHDVVQVIDALGVESLAVGGLSAGGSYAMAVASAYPDRVTRAVPYNPASPIHDVAAMAGSSRTTRMAYRYMAKNPDKVVARVMNPRPPGLAARTLQRFTLHDRHLLDDPVNAAAEKANQDAMRAQPGSGYLAQELDIVSAPWGFDHRAVSVPVTLVSGVKDGSLKDSRTWMSEVPNGRLVTVPGGHGGMPDPVVARRIVEVLAGLA